MSKRKKHAEEHENLERWLVSYADFMTLLFATFVVLYALSQIDIAKFKDLRVSLQKAFSGASLIEGSDSKGVMDRVGSTLFEGEKDQTSIIQPIFENIAAKMEESSFNNVQKELTEFKEKNELQGVDIKIDERGLVITLVDSLMFNSGSAVIKTTAYPALTKIGQLLNTKFSSHSIRVEGHTDNIPIKSALYPSNWELSSARSSSVVRFMLDNLKLSKNRFSAVGYADTVPVASNDIEAGRSKNRRVEIVVLRDKLSKSEPQLVKLEKIIPKPKEESKINKNSKTPGELSDAAKKLLRETGQSVQSVILYKDSYDKETERLQKELKAKEQRANTQPAMPEEKSAQTKTN